MTEAEEQMRALIDGLDLTEPEAQDVTTLDDRALIALMSHLDQELLDRHEVRHPSTDRGRELHSTRSACVVELNSRGLL